MGNETSKTKSSDAIVRKHKNAEIPLSLTGYIHEFETSNSYIIPFGIMLIIWEYLKLIKFKWDKENKTEYAEFISDKTVSFSRFGIVIGDTLLSKKTFKKYSYSIKIVKVGNNSMFYGFVSHPFNESIGEWNAWYCVGGNRSYSKKQFAIEVWPHHYPHSLCGYGGNLATDNRYSKVIQNTVHKLSDGDILKVQVDFDTKIATFIIGDYQVTHNDIDTELIPSICAPHGTIISLCDFDQTLR